MSPCVLAPGCLVNETAVVTGAGSGLGRAIALRLLSLGATVVGMGRRIERLRETADMAGEHAARFDARSVDLRDADALESTSLDVASAHPVSILVNNAGGQFVAPAADVTLRGWRALIELNLTAVFLLCRLSHASLARARGSIVNISLSPVERGALGISHGIAARAGVLGLSRSLALEWAPDGIRVNCIGPGSVATAGLEEEVTPGSIPRLVEAIPLGRLTRPEEVAELIGSLVSPAGRLVSGQLLHIDGLAHLGAPVDLLSTRNRPKGGDPS